MPKERGEALRQKIIQVASGMFHNLGFKGTSMRALADKLGVTPPVIYYYFKSKEDLHFACVHGGLHKLETESRTVGGELHADLRQHFAATVRALLRWQLSHRVESLPLADADGRDPAMAKQYKAIKKMQRNALDRLKELIVQGQREGQFEPVDPTVSAFAIIGMGAHIPRWAQKKGKLSLDDIVELHTVFALRIVGARTVGVVEVAKVAKASLGRPARADRAPAAPVSTPSRRRSVAAPR